MKSFLVLNMARRKPNMRLEVVLQGCSRTGEQSNTKLCVLDRHAEEAQFFMLRAVDLDGVVSLTSTA